MKAIHAKTPPKPLPPPASKRTKGTKSSSQPVDHMITSEKTSGRNKIVASSRKEDKPVILDSKTKSDTESTKSISSQAKDTQSKDKVAKNNDVPMETSSETTKEETGTLKGRASGENRQGWHV